MNVADVVSEIEATGVAFRLDGEKICVRYPDEERRAELAEQITALRQQRREVAAYLRERGKIPPMPSGICLVKWNLKKPPVAIEMYALVTDPNLFANSTIEQLRTSLANPRRWVGWTIPQLIDRLAQVGVIVALESKPEQG